MRDNFFTKIYNTFFLSNDEKNLYKCFKAKKNITTNKKDIILVQCVEDYFYFGLFGEIVNSIKNKNDIHVEQYVVRNLTLGATSSIRNFLISIFFANRFRDNKWLRLYSSYCDSIAYRHEGSSNLYFDIKAWFRAYKIFKSLNSKEELLELIIDDIKVGDLIYDSYLRFKPAPTVDINDFYLCIVIWQTIRNIHIADKYFKTKSPLVLLTSYSTYIQHGVTVRVALKYDTKVFTFGNFQSFRKKLNIDDYFHTANFKNYKTDFNKFKDKKIFLERAKKILNKKLNGTIDNSTAYMKESAYKIFDDLIIPDLTNHIVIFLHDFFDSPHIYGEMIFCDFLEWIEFTISILDQYHIPYALKPHPNQIGDSKSVIKSLKIKYPDTKFISSRITNKQLVTANIRVGITVYGTVAHELVYLGIPIITCGENPHSSYNFCFQAKTIEEYIRILKDYKKLTTEEIYIDEVLSFYYMHNLNKTIDEILLIDNLLKFHRYTHDNYNNYDISIYNEKLNNLIKNKEFNKFIERLL